MTLNSFFPSRTITWYLAKTFLVRILAVVAGMALILQTLDLLSESGRILAYEGNGQAQILRYISLRMPQIVSWPILPFSVLLATIITLTTLNQNSEVISLKASGLSAHQVLAPLIVAALGVAIVSFAFNDRVVARATATLDTWRKVDYGPIPVDRGDRTNVWVRRGNDLIHASRISGRGAGARLAGVSLYEREAGRLTYVILADAGRPEGNGWRVTNARRFDVASGRQSALGNPLVAQGVRPDQFTLSSVSADGLSFGALSAAIDDLRDAGRPTKALEGNLWHKLSGPLSAVLMPLLGAVAAFGVARSGKLFIRAVIGMALGFAYFVADNFALAMGTLGAYPPFLAAWAPFLLFLLVGEAVLIRTEE
ncbi:lipopolysaccharide export system permease protein [Sphingomonas guangdongensis]|uniref:Lipopolysaccharide export system permease protein n=1 Tax=Sphingomonas guangdongensis TaxID=1141890 RepID=A0A285QYK3_9SPHN|nr:LPS export ABC transporter permease LptG [Sphingomonas guangdongensis]SOB86906.1 lipopolysaccharide export system permease protein [Sphingomonas guangdongensis]